LHYTLSTNGVLLDNHVELLNSYPPEKIVISLDSSDSENYARLRGSARNTLSLVIQNVQKLLSSRVGEHPRVKINMSIQPGNIEEILDVVKLVEDVGVDEMSVSHLQWAGGDESSFHLTSNAPTTGAMIARAVDIERLLCQLRMLPRWVEQHPPLTAQTLMCYYQTQAYGSVKL
jgi:molybdenum cofactor biosynthesis enzyme MoaA